MVRQIIHIDEEKCNGCGLCAAACHEGAIDIIDGKAKLVRENFCDGFGDCLPGCPTGAITFEDREAPAYDEQAVAASKKQKEEKKAQTVKILTPVSEASSQPAMKLLNWPVQIKLAPLQAPYFDQADLLIAADCTAYAYASYHRDFQTGRVTLIGCTKLDNVDYSEKLTEIFRNNEFLSVTVLRMTVPCCGGMERAVKTALSQSGKDLPIRVVTIGIDGKIAGIS